MIRHDLFWVLRILGKIFLVSGFLLSIYALSQASDSLVRYSLVLIASGIVLMAASVYHALKRRGRDRGPTGWKSLD